MCRSRRGNRSFGILKRVGAGWRYENYGLALRTWIAIFESMLRHIWDFLSAVIANWVALAGGIIGVLIGLLERHNKKPFIGRPFWCAMAFALLISCFWAWRDERLQVEALHLDKISLTPKELVQIFNERTTAQGENLAAVYTGKWIEVSGTISDVKFWPNGLFWKRAGVTLMNNDDPKNNPVVGATFVEKWTEPFSALRVGEKIRALGQIRKIEKGWVWLEDCELMEIVQRPTPAPSPAQR